MKTRSAINKGLRFENYLKDIFRKELDAGTHGNSGSGNGLDKGDLRIPSMNMVVEAKNASKINLIKDWEQTKLQTFHDEKPTLAIRNPKLAEFQETLIVMDLGTFIELAKGGNEQVEVVETLDYQKRRMIENLVRSAKEVLNKWEKV